MQRDVDGQMRFPFLKLQLIKENPCHIPDAHEWAALLQEQAPLFPRDLIESMKTHLIGGQEATEASVMVDSCDAVRAMHLHVKCHEIPPKYPHWPSAELIGLEDGSIISAEAAVSVRVFVNHAHDIAAQCHQDDVSANVLIEVFLADDVFAPLVSFVQKIRPQVTFYVFKLPLKPDNYTITTSITSPDCPDLVTHAYSPHSVRVVSNQQLLAVQPGRVSMTIVDQIKFNACVAPHEFESCIGFTMHGDLGYIGQPRHALWSRHVTHNENVLFFYQWGINKAPFFPNSVVKVLIAMESRAAEATMWQYLDNLQFDSHPPPFDFVLTHDRALLERTFSQNYEFPSSSR